MRVCKKMNLHPVLLTGKESFPWFPIYSSAIQMVLVICLMTEMSFIQCDILLLRLWSYRLRGVWDGVVQTMTKAFFFCFAQEKMCRKPQLWLFTPRSKIYSPRRLLCCSWLDKTALTLQQWEKPKKKERAIMYDLQRPYFYSQITL